MPIPELCSRFSITALAAAAALAGSAANAQQQETSTHVVQLPTKPGQSAPNALFFTLNGGPDTKGQAIALVEGDPLRARLFPPELIMQHAADIGLTADQREAIIRIAEQSQSRTTRLSLETTGARNELVAALDATPTDVAKVLAQLDHALEQEKQLKLENFDMLLKIRNELTAEQQEKLKHVAGPAFGLTATKVIAPIGGVASLRGGPQVLEWGQLPDGPVTAPAP